MPKPFIDALLAAPTPIIAEVKRRSAHGEDLIRGRSIAEIVSAYHDFGAPCLSVVTGAWFGGSNHLLAEVASLTGLPILKKDFITRESQILEAKEMGASAVLLTACILPAATLRTLTQTCLRHGVTPFVEVSGEDQLDRLSLGAGCVVAVNNKDILLRESDDAKVGRSLALLPSILDTGTRCPVSASGIERPDVAAKLLNAGYRGLLIGTALLLSEDLGGWFAELECCRQMIPQAAE